MIRTALGIVRFSAFCLLTGGSYGVLYLAGRVSGSDASRRMRWRNRVMRWWARGTAAIVGMRVQAQGTLPQPPFLLVTNHLSYMDIVALSTHIDCVFVAKAEVAAWPGIGRAAREVGTIFINRLDRSDVSRVGALIEQALNRGQGVVLFPEGTSSAGAQVLPFRAPLLEPAARRGLAVAYASLTYRVPPMEQVASHSVCWWGNMAFLPHFLALCRMSGFDAVLHFGAEPVVAGDRKQLAAKLHSMVQGQFIPVKQKGNIVCGEPQPTTISSFLIK